MAHTFLVALNGFLVATHGVQCQATRIPQQRRFPVGVCLLLRAHLPLVSLVLQCGVQLFCRGIYCFPQHQRLLEIFQPCKKTQDLKKQYTSEFVVAFVYGAAIKCYLACNLSIGGTVAPVAETCPGHARSIQWHWTNLGLGWVGSGQGSVVCEEKNNANRNKDTFG